VLDEHGLRRVLALFLRELVANEIGVDRAAERHVDAACVDAVGLADREEALAECAVDEHERAVAARQRVGDRGLHRAGAGGCEREHVTLRTQEILERARQRCEQRRELGTAVVDHRSGRRGEHRLRHHGGTRDPEILGAIHVLSL
jgi:hypothetical protein